ncbi:hypothetical protein BVY01_00650 [bacterium I07]|nr:hypothetical protein BVY01_00650 [bacterium I07]
MFKRWKPFKHPTFGDIEIGGWVKMSTRLPPPFLLQELVHRNASAVLFAAEQTPEIKLELFENKKISKNLYRIRLRLTNTKALPSISHHFVTKKVMPQDILTITGASIQVLAGGRLDDRFLDQTSYKKHKPEVQFVQVPGHGSIEYEFLISGKGDLEVNYTSLKAGKFKKTVSLN